MMILPLCGFAQMQDTAVRMNGDTILLNPDGTWVDMKDKVDEDTITVIDLPKICKKNITVKQDEFEGNRTIYSPLSDKMGFYKDISRGGVSTYYLSAKTYGPTVVYDGEGIFILFEDGTKLTRKGVKVNVDYVSREYSPYKYSVFMRLTDEEIDTLKKKKVSKFKLYVFDENLTKKESSNLFEYANCIQVIE